MTLQRYNIKYNGFWNLPVSNLVASIWPQHSPDVARILGQFCSYPYSKCKETWTTGALVLASGVNSTEFRPTGLVNIDGQWYTIFSLFLLPPCWQIMFCQRKDRNKILTIKLSIVREQCLQSYHHYQLPPVMALPANSETKTERRLIK